MAIHKKNMMFISMPRTRWGAYFGEKGMCGIAGIIHQRKETLRRGSLGSILNRIGHRGPDGSGLMEMDGALLAHCRLSIIDVEGGRQPLASSDGRLHVVCNGEIYNHQAIRQTMEACYAFHSRSDSEVLLPLYEHVGPELVFGLDGMYAFILAGRNRFYAARDPLGIKPLYFGRHASGLTFASEAKGLDGEVDEIEEFPPGHFYTPATGFIPYYQPPDPPFFYQDEASAAAAVRAALKKSVRKRLMSDVPVGIFLSGGLDSSIIAALARETGVDLHTFAVGLPDAPDLAAARRVAEYIGSHHHEVVLSEDKIRQAIPRIIYHLESSDRSLVRSAVPNWFVARLAAETHLGDGSYCKVILTGEGADELFAGYHYMRDYTDPLKLQDESRRLLKELHGLNLQRLDRMTMAHGIEGRVPFLDVQFIETALSIDPALKLFERYGQEKGFLRTAFGDLLPPEILQREKLEFAAGATSDDYLGRLFSEGGQLDAAAEQEYYDGLLARQFRTPFAPSARHRWQGPVL